ncbi:pancreatic triacylglycerol lipase-like isoform X1 [Lytechinus variegatus]|uniref:pancreatic triacylglycerol lipase-like isoform X1 n=2 Tax=Lytechinus variegatus TaxID=7654 RepID=UPI001BB10073|nr:pancreatic triacylglycerol lipase-like isoform X1 [Lytechinus variegatus]
MERMISSTLLVILLSLSSVCWASDSVCYGELGCFTDDPPYCDPPSRPVWLPKSPEEIGTEFMLNTRNVPTTSWEEYQTLSTDFPDDFYQTDFQSYRDTKIITHGFSQSSSVAWMREMVDQFLIEGDFNVIRVDWQRGAIGAYGISAANTRVVGAHISLLIDKLKLVYGVDASSFHIIGHSLGAQVSGYAGERQSNPQVARITGLDPAGPYFEDTDPIVRLDPSDATYVDVIHTDTDPLYNFGYGMYAPCGHMDFYPNGGNDQPGCDPSLIEDIIVDGFYEGVCQFVACNHLRSIEYFKESISSPEGPYLAFKCSRDHDDYNLGLCFDTSHCAPMGWHSPLGYPGGENHMYQINTNDDEPYAGYQYQFTFKFDDHRKAHDAKGLIYITLMGNKAQSSKVALTSETTEYYTNTAYVYMTPYDVGPDDTEGLVSIYFEWDYDADWYKWWDWEAIERPELFIHQIQVIDSQGNKYIMCGDYNGIEPGDVKAFISSADGATCP